MEITLLGQDEWRILRDLRFRAVTDAPDEMGETVQELKDRTSDQYWIQQTRQYAGNPENKGVFVVRENGAPSGLIYSEVQVSGTCVTASLAAMWLDPILRGRGIGRQLLTTAVDWAKARGATHASLLVAESNKRAIAFYERAGFYKTSPLPKPLGRRRFWSMGRQFSGEV